MGSRSKTDTIPGRRPLGDKLPSESIYFSSDFHGFGDGISFDPEDAAETYLSKVYHNICGHIATLERRLRQIADESDGRPTKETLALADRMVGLKYAVTLITPLIPESEWRNEFEDMLFPESPYEIM